MRQALVTESAGLGGPTKSVVASKLRGSVGLKDQGALNGTRTVSARDELVGARPRRGERGARFLARSGREPCR